MKKLKLIPPFTMLFAGMISSVSLYLLDCDLLTTLVIVFTTLFVFYFLGVVIMKILQDIWEKEEKKRMQQEAENEENIEKEVIEEQTDTSEVN